MRRPRVEIEYRERTIVGVKRSYIGFSDVLALKRRTTRVRPNIKSLNNRMLHLGRAEARPPVEVEW